MQHHGVPTRLLDWSTSPLVGAYFATSREEEDKDASLWALNPHGLNLAYSHTEEDTLAPGDNLHLFAPAFLDGSAETNSVLALRPIEDNPRVISQNSVFTIHSDRRPLNKTKELNKLLIRFRIPGAAKKTLRNDLYKLGIKESSLFPDLDHLASELKTLRFDT